MKFSNDESTKPSISAKSMDKPDFRNTSSNCAVSKLISMINGTNVRKCRIKKKNIVVKKALVDTTPESVKLRIAQRTNFIL